MIFGRTKTTMIQPDAALKGRDTPIVEPGNHFVNGHSLVAPFPEGFQQIVVGLGCFWGAERVFWQTEGVWVTAVGYAGGYTPNPTYEEVCSARTGHNEVVLVVFDPSIITLEQVLAKFFEAHNPTQGMAQGNDVGTQYRSGIYVNGDEQRAAATAARDAFQTVLDGAGFGQITTEVEDLGPFYYAETYHQQYLAKNPGGYCGLGGTGLSCPIGLETD